MGGAAPSSLRNFDGRTFTPDVLARAKGGRRVSVCLPARNEEATIGPIVAEIGALAERWPVVDEVLVVDDASVDGTVAAARAAGARVVSAAAVAPQCGPGTGKGEALWKAVLASEGELLVFCDADIKDFTASFVTGLLGPLLLHDDVAFVKGWYDRSLDEVPGEGGRVTELVARPLLALLFPELAGFRQPLAGEFAARRDVLERVPFVHGYGVDLGLLLDVAALTGLSRMAQVFLGHRAHRNRPLAELAPQALEVAGVALRRAGVETHVRDAKLSERPPAAEVR